MIAVYYKILTIIKRKEKTQDTIPTIGNNFNNKDCSTLHAVIWEKPEAIISSV